MKRSQPRKRKKAKKSATPTKLMAGAVAGRVSIFRNGSHQAVRLSQELRFSENVKEVRIRKQAGALLLSPIRPDWASFFALETDVPDDFLADREDLPPQPRDPLGADTADPSQGLSAV